MRQLSDLLLSAGDSAAGAAAAAAAATPSPSGLIPRYEARLVQWGERLQTDLTELDSIKQSLHRKRDQLAEKIFRRSGRNEYTFAGHQADSEQQQQLQRIDAQILAVEADAQRLFGLSKHLHVIGQLLRSFHAQILALEDDAGALAQLKQLTQVTHYNAANTKQLNSKALLAALPGEIGATYQALQVRIKVLLQAPLPGYDILQGHWQAHPVQLQLLQFFRNELASLLGPYDEFAVDSYALPLLNDDADARLSIDAGAAALTTTTTTTTTTTAASAHRGIDVDNGRSDDDDDEEIDVDYNSSSSPPAAGIGHAALRRRRRAEHSDRGSELSPAAAAVANTQLPHVFASSYRITQVHPTAIVGNALITYLFGDISSWLTQIAEQLDHHYFNEARRPVLNDCHHLLQEYLAINERVDAVFTAMRLHFGNSEKKKTPFAEGEPLRKQIHALFSQMQAWHQKYDQRVASKHLPESVEYYGTNGKRETFWVTELITGSGQTVEFADDEVDTQSLVTADATQALYKKLNAHLYRAASNRQAFPGLRGMRECARLLMVMELNAIFADMLYTPRAFYGAVEQGTALRKHKTLAGKQALEHVLAYLTRAVDAYYTALLSAQAAPSDENKAALTDALQAIEEAQLKCQEELVAFHQEFEDNLDDAFNDARDILNDCEKYWSQATYDAFFNSRTFDNQDSVHAGDNNAAVKRQLALDNVNGLLREVGHHLYKQRKTLDSRLNGSASDNIKGVIPTLRENHQKLLADNTAVLQVQARALAESQALLEQVFAVGDASADAAASMGGNADTTSASAADRGAAAAGAGVTRTPSETLAAIIRSLTDSLDDAQASAASRSSSASSASGASASAAQAAGSTLDSFSVAALVASAVPAAPPQSAGSAAEAASVGDSVADDAEAGESFKHLTLFTTEQLGKLHEWFCQFEPKNEARHTMHQLRWHDKGVQPLSVDNTAVRNKLGQANQCSVRAVARLQAMIDAKLGRSGFGTLRKMMKEGFASSAKAENNLSLQLADIAVLYLPRIKQLQASLQHLLKANGLSHFSLQRAHYDHALLLYTLLSTLQATLASAVEQCDALAVSSSASAQSQIYIALGKDTQNDLPTIVQELSNIVETLGLVPVWDQHSAAYFPIPNQVQSMAALNPFDGYYQLRRYVDGPLGIEDRIGEGTYRASYNPNQTYGTASAAVAAAAAGGGYTHDHSGDDYGDDDDYHAAADAGAGAGAAAASAGSRDNAGNGGRTLTLIPGAATALYGDAALKSEAVADARTDGIDDDAAAAVDAVLAAAEAAVDGKRKAGANDTDTTAAAAANSTSAATPEAPRSLPPSHGASDRSSRGSDDGSYASDSDTDNSTAAKPKKKRKLRPLKNSKKAAAALSGKLRSRSNSRSGSRHASDDESDGLAATGTTSAASTAAMLTALCANSGGGAAGALVNSASTVPTPAAVAAAEPLPQSSKYDFQPADDGEDDTQQQATALPVSSQQPPLVAQLGVHATGGLAGGGVPHTLDGPATPQVATSAAQAAAEAAAAQSASATR